MNIVDLVLFQCRLQPAIAALCAPGKGIGLVSYGQLERFIHSIARQARALGLARGNVVALFINDPILHSAFILGLSHVGVVTLSGRSVELPKELKIDAVISDAPHPFKNIGRIIYADQKWIEGDGVPLALAPAERGGSDDLCRITLTSGTTGEAKACGFSHDKLVRRIARYGWAYGSKLPECSRIFIDPSLATAIGHLFWLHTLARGGSVFFRGNEPVETFQALSLYKVQAMVAAPAALAEFVQFYEGAPAFPPSLEMIATAGSLMSRTLAERVRAQLCSNLVCGYGSTETHTVATASSHAIAHVPGAVGYVAPGMAVEITDVAGNTLPPGEEGIVRIRSEVAAEGYLGDPAETQKAFRGGWFHPGDIGTLTANGLLVISGREKSVLNLGGDKVSPERIEQVLGSFPGITSAAAFSVVNAMGIEELCAAVAAGSFNEPALRAHCERHLPPEYVPLRFLAVPEIPLNEMGKIDRRRTAELVMRL